MLIANKSPATRYPEHFSSFVIDKYHVSFLFAEHFDQIERMFAKLPRVKFDQKLVEIWEIVYWESFALCCNMGHVESRNKKQIMENSDMRKVAIHSYF